MNNQNQPAKQKDPSATPFSGYSGPPPPPLPPLPPPYPQSYYPMFEYPSAFGPPVNLKHLASQCDDPVTRAVAKSAMLVQKAAVRTKVGGNEASCRLTRFLQTFFVSLLSSVAIRHSSFSFLEKKKVENVEKNIVFLFFLYKVNPCSYLFAGPSEPTDK